MPPLLGIAHTTPNFSLLEAETGKRFSLEELLADHQILKSNEAVFPTAGKLGELVFQRLKKGIESEPFEPLYMHPPVFIAPRFPA